MKDDDELVNYLVRLNKKARQANIALSQRIHETIQKLDIAEKYFGQKLDSFKKIAKMNPNKPAESEENEPDYASKLEEQKQELQKRRQFDDKIMQMLKVLTTLTRQENEERASFNEANKAVTKMDEHDRELRQMLPYPETILAFSNEQGEQDDNSHAANSVRDRFKESLSVGK